MTETIPEFEHIPHEVDSYVGSMIRMRRKLLKMSQQDLADAIGLTFQQVQKYERGANRVSASKLFDIARALGVEIKYFFPALEPSDRPEHSATSETEKAVHTFLSTAEGIALAEAFPRIASSKLRRRALDLVRTLADDEADMI